MGINYTKSEGVYIAYRVEGTGDESIIFVPGLFSNLAIDRYWPVMVEWENFLCRFGRVINFDKRATGVSDRSARPLNLDQQVVDVEAVRVASGSEDLIVCGLSQGAPLAVLYALAFPERVRALILIEGVCCDASDPYADLSDSNRLLDWERSLAEFDADFAKWCWNFSKLIVPGATSEDLDLSVEYMQATASPSSHRFMWCCLMGFDLRPMLRHVTKPTLVIHGTGDQMYPVQHGRYFAEKIPGAEYLELPSGYHVPMFDENVVPQLFEGIEQFITNLPTRHTIGPSPRVVSTVLVTDIVDSTKQQREMGNHVWSDKMSSFEKNSADIVARCRGQIANLTGDGVIATFEVPGDGLRAARLLVQDADGLGHPIRAGLHTGEVELTDKGLHGLAVTIASRVADQAGAGEVLTTTVTQGIVEGGNYEFSDWGETDLKGIGTRKLVRLK